MLNQERQKIDAIDRELVRLFEERMTVVKNIIAIKKQQNLPILDQGREEEVIAKVTSYLADKSLEGDLTALYTELMRLSRNFQAKL